MEPAPLYHDIMGAASGGVAVFCTASDGMKIRVAYWPGGDKGTALLFPGRTEYIEKYDHMIAALQARGLNVVVIDWRGQGLSERPDNRTDIGYVAAFADYQKDIAAALAIPEVAAFTGPRYLFAHSMGGCIGLRALIDGLAVKSAIFSAPMWGLPGPKLLGYLLRMFNVLGTAFGVGKTLIPGANPAFYVNFTSFENNELTKDAARYAAFREHLAHYRALGLGGATVRWAAEALAEIEALQTAQVPDIPMQVFLGTKESIVDPVAVKRRIATLPNARLEMVDDGRHENWMETPEILAHIWQVSDQFLAANR